MIKLLITTFAIAHIAMAGESKLTVTYQPLDGLGSATIQIVQVTCHDWYSHSGQPTQIGLISAKNIPPSNNPKEATENLNLASVCRIRFGTSDLGDKNAALELYMNSVGFQIPERYGHPKEDIVRSSLECLRRCLPERLMKTPVLLSCDEKDKLWLEKIVAEFNRHDRTKVFFTPQT